jgi:ABC-type nitrate/sulfonate/bicarbonate transport system substrate-binding protein
MAEYAPIQIRGSYRATSHLPIWQLMFACGVWQQVGIEMVSFDFIRSARQAEGLLLDGEIDFISGNHVSPYTRYLSGSPIVHLASPSNGVRMVLASRERLSDLSQVRGLRLGETSPYNLDGSLQHIRGNHILYLRRAGVAPDEVSWVELADEVEEDARDTLLGALQAGRIDVAFVTGSPAAFEASGYHVLPLGELPMINGPTLTTTLPNLQRKDRLGERLVKAMVLAIHLARTRSGEANGRMRAYAERRGQKALTSARVARMPQKPYPTLEGIANAYELACIQTPSTRGQASPLALWDLHYLRELDASSFIDALYADEPTAVPSGSA